MTSPGVALTGTTGFLGSAVHDALSRLGLPTTVLARDVARTPVAPSTRAVPGNLGDPAALAALCRGADVLVHAASYVGSDTALQEAVNVTGTRDLMAAARDAGVRRVVYLSTAGVYAGRLGPGHSEERAVVAPRSTLSASRRAAEEVVLAAGGVVLRPHLVHGRGDRWFLAPLLAAMARTGAWIGDPGSLLSTIGRERLGELTALLALGDAPGGVYHAAEPEPVTVRDLVTEVHRRAGLAVPAAVLSRDEALTRLAPLGVTAAQLDLVTGASWYDSTKVWQTTGVSPARLGVPLLLPEAVDEYAAVLTR